MQERGVGGAGPNELTQLAFVFCDGGGLEDYFAFRGVQMEAYSAALLFQLYYVVCYHLGFTFEGEVV